MWKLAARLGMIGLLVCLGADVGLARGGGHFGGGGGGGFHFGGGGVPHFGGGGFGPHFGGGGVAHIGGGGIPRFNVGRSLGGAFVRFGGARLGRFAGRAGRFGGPSFHGRLARNRRAGRLPAMAHARAPAVHMGRTNTRSFAARRQFASTAAFRPFLGRRWPPWWRRYWHFGWLGPLFWPYAYGDFFYCGLWPDDYCYYDPFWAYGYGDIYEAIFFPYSYEEYVSGRAPRRA